MPSVKKPRPLHPFRFLAVGQTNPHHTPLPRGTNTFEHQIISLLHSGARVLFDIKAKRGLIYSVRRGVEHLCEITARTLSSLLHQGYVVMVARHKGVIHYALAGSNHQWYAPE